jgi:hypothetical protein
MHDKPMLLWIWLTAKSMHFELGLPPSSDTLGLTNMTNPYYLNLADYQVRTLGTWLSAKSTGLESSKHAKPTSCELGWLQVHVLWTWLSCKVHTLWICLCIKFRSFGSNNHARSTSCGLDWLPSSYTLDLASFLGLTNKPNPRILGFDKYARPILLWTWLALSLGVLGITNIPDPCYVDLVARQVHAIWTWLVPSLGILGLENMPHLCYFGLGWP